METKPILYKRTTTGAIQEWYQNLDGSRYQTVSGQKDGQKVTSEWTVCKGKNLGRANETSPEEQARREVEANYTKKLKESYKTDISAIDEITVPKPMLAKDYNEYPIGDFSNVYAQPKLDGLRCLGRKDNLFSRQGNPILAVPHIHESIRAIYDFFPDLILDGELYNHDLKHDFNKIVSLCKRLKPTAEDFANSKELIQYWVYDSNLPGPFHERSQRLREILSNLPDFGLCIQWVPTFMVESQEELDSLYETWAELEFEGQMVRISGPEYEQKRTKNLLKRKEFLEDEFPLKQIVEGVGNRSGMAGYAVLTLPDGREFKANIKGDRAYLRKLLEEDQSGKIATVIFFKPTPAGIPRFGRVKTIHDGPRW